MTLVEQAKSVLAGKIREYRLANKITMNELSSRLGVSLRHSYYIRDGVGVTVDDLLRYCEKLGIGVVIL